MVFEINADCTVCQFLVHAISNVKPTASCLECFRCRRVFQIPRPRTVMTQDFRQPVFENQPSTDKSSKSSWSIPYEPATPESLYSNGIKPNEYQDDDDQVSDKDVDETEKELKVTTKRKIHGNRKTIKGRRRSNVKYSKVVVESDEDKWCAGKTQKFQKKTKKKKIEQEQENNSGSELESTEESEEDRNKQDEEETGSSEDDEDGSRCAKCHQVWHGKWIQCDSCQDWLCQDCEPKLSRYEKKRRNYYCKRRNCQKLKRRMEAMR